MIFQLLVLSYLVAARYSRYPPSKSMCPVENCGFCHPWKGCFWCEEGYYKTRESCESCRDRDPNCLDCSRFSCNLCAGGYYFSYKDRRCMPCVDSCVECDRSGFCLRCENGESPNKDGSCNPVICPAITCEFRVDNCLFCRGCFLCETCQEGFHLDKDGNCVCSSESCNTCEEGSFNDNGLCRSCRDFDPSCVTCSSDRVCDQCAGGYYNDNGVCIPCSLSCLECIDNTQCTRCEHGDVEDDGFCPPVACPILPCPDRVENCEICRGCNVCDECQPGFFLDLEGMCR